MLFHLQIKFKILPCFKTVFDLVALKLSEMLLKTIVCAKCANQKMADKGGNPI